MKEVDDYVSNSENTFAAYKGITRTHLNQPLDTFIPLIILSRVWHFSAFPFIPAVANTIEQKFIFQIGIFIPRGINERF